ncbi:MAG: serine/threonine protein kinase [Sinobacteraceae bacterium]|nr:serine/threonine protein kinase [Nevskiaceae bacterium]
MLPEVSANWPVLSELLDEVLALPPEEREGWLRTLPAEHWPLRETLRRLLEVQAGIETRPFLETLPKLTATSAPVSGLAAGDEVGRYRLIEELGTGGMGCVWLAERADGQLKRKIALKLPRMVWADDLATRMARERDILGALEHPNIARLYDAGVDDKGRPYLALEYVEGQRIDAYCDARSLTLRQRLELFLQVIAAVQYAHVNLVIHRDIKPANVLINQQGAAKLLDFGIARLEVDVRVLQELGDAAETSTRAMTPRYASPEQVRGERLSLVSDVYSLGVLLYELLTGRSPYHLRNDSRAALEIAVTEGDIRPPSRAEVSPQAAQSRQSNLSKLSKALRGDLDAILMKALSLDANTRYLTVQAFGEDLTRWLRGEVILAKRAPAYEVLRKFILRHRWPVSIAAVSVVAVVATAIVAVWQAREARQESRRATATRDFLIALFDDANPELRGGKDVTARELLIEGEKRLPSALASEPELQAEVLLSIANVWARFGDVEKTMAATERRSGIFQLSGNKRMHIEALLDEAHLASQISDITRLNEVIGRIEKVYGSSAPKYMTEKSQSELFWLRGWAALTSARLGDATEYFAAAEKLSDAANDVELKIRARYGQFQTAIKLGDRVAALRIFKSSFALLSEARLAQADQLHRGFELVSGLYLLGEFKEGWSEINRLMTVSMDLYGADNASQEMLQRYWLNWAIQLEKFDDARSWLINHRISPKECKEKIKNEKEQWCLIYARVLAGAGDLETSLEILRQLDKSAATLSRDEKFLVQVSEVEVLIKSGRLYESIPKLNKLEEVKSAYNQSSVVKFYGPWLRGAISFREKDYGSASRELGEAEATAESQFGRDHPRTLQARIWKSVSEYEVQRAGGESKNIFDAMRRDVSLLGQRIGQDHSVTEKVYRVLRKYDVSRSSQLSQSEQVSDIL